MLFAMDLLACSILCHRIHSVYWMLEHHAVDLPLEPQEVLEALQELKTRLGESKLCNPIPFSAELTGASHYKDSKVCSGNPTEMLQDPEESLYWSCSIIVPGTLNGGGPTSTHL